MAKNDTVKTRFQQDIAEHLKRVKWIGEEYARRQAEPDEPVKPVQRKRSPRNQPKGHGRSKLSEQDAQLRKENAALQNFFALQNLSLERHRYKSMASEIGKLQREVRDTLLTAPMLEMAKIALPNLDKITTWKGLTRLLQNLLYSLDAGAETSPSERQQEVLAKIELAKQKHKLSDLKIAEKAGYDRSNITRMRQGKPIKNAKILDEFETAVNVLTPASP